MDYSSGDEIPCTPPEVLEAAQTAIADDLYWNPMDLDSDESVVQDPKQYIDPWDLENYAYIRQHLDSVDLNSDPSSLGETQETAFYYVPAKMQEVKRSESYYDVRKATPRLNKYDDYYYAPPLPKFPTGRYDTLTISEHGTAGYAAIDEMTIRNERASAGKRRRQSVLVTGNHHGRNRFERNSIMEYDDEMENTYDEGMRRETLMRGQDLRPAQNRTIMKNMVPKTTKHSRTRSHSFSVGDYDLEPYRPSQSFHQPLYNGVEDLYVRPDYDSTGTSPIYDDIRSQYPRSKPRNFKLSNYGHLQIDYSCSWNNLNNYIYN